MIDQAGYVNKATILHSCAACARLLAFATVKTNMQVSHADANRKEVLSVSNVRTWCLPPRVCQGAKLANIASVRTSWFQHILRRLLDQNSRQRQGYREYLTLITTTSCSPSLLPTTTCLCVLRKEGIRQLPAEGGHRDFQERHGSGRFLDEETSNLAPRT